MTCHIKPWRVPRLFGGDTIVILGGGPSLNPKDIELAHHVGCPIIAINDAWRLAPDAAALYACDAKWWRWHKGVPGFRGLKLTQDREALSIYPDIRWLMPTGGEGLEPDPRGLRTGRSSGYQAINLAVHLGAARILLLGYDMKRAEDGRSHWFGEHPDGIVPDYKALLVPPFKTLVEPLEEHGIEVINCTPGSALPVFPIMSLSEALSGALAGAA